MKKAIFYFYEALRLSWQAIRSHKLRTLLTMLGISIGIFSITMIFTLVNTLQYSVTLNLSSLGSTILYVHNWPWKDNSEDWYKYFNRPKVSLMDYEKLKNELKYTVAINFSYIKNGATAKYKKNTAEGIQIIGCTRDFVYVNNFEIEKGRFLSEFEINGARKNCVLGYQVAKNFFGTLINPIGEEIILQGKKFKIVGVIAPQGDMNIFGPSIDFQIIIPYTTFANTFDVTKRSVDRLITVKAESPEKVYEVENQIIGLIRAKRGLKPSQEDNFSVNKQEALMEQFDQIFGALNVGGTIISLFSLLVGGFGIANIMFVCVKERTVEIGIQKALGSTKHFILQQFLLEAIILCVAGGLIGIFFLFSISGVLQWLIYVFELGFVMTIKWKDIFLGIGLSVLIGLISGFLPAFTAANLDPVEAMRS